jgi:hypothetical protein
LAKEEKERNISLSKETRSQKNKCHSGGKHAKKEGMEEEKRRRMSSPLSFFLWFVDRYDLPFFYSKGEKREQQKCVMAL